MLRVISRTGHSTRWELAGRPRQRRCILLLVIHRGRPTQTTCPLVCAYLRIYVYILGTSAFFHRRRTQQKPRASAKPG